MRPVPTVFLRLAFSLQLTVSVGSVSVSPVISPKKALLQESSLAIECGQRKGRGGRIQNVHFRVLAAG